MNVCVCVWGGGGGGGGAVLGGEVRGMGRGRKILYSLANYTAVYEATL